MDFKPVRSSPVTASTFWHSYKNAFPESACFAGCPILLVDNAFVIVLAVIYGVHVVIGAAEEGLKQKQSVRFKLKVLRNYVFSKY